MFSCVTAASGFTLPETNLYHIQGLCREDRFLFPLVGYATRWAPTINICKTPNCEHLIKLSVFPSFFVGSKTSFFAGDPKSQVRQPT